MIQRLLDKPRSVFFWILIIIILSCIFFFVRSSQLRHHITLEKESTFTENRPPSKNDHYRVYNQEARTTIINYISMDCVHCKNAYIAEDAFLSSLGEKNTRVNIIYRHNPLASQKLSQEKALLSECVYQQGGDEAFFAFVRNIFNSYNEDQTDNRWVQKIALSYVASETVLATCMNDTKTRDAIQAQKNENIISSINETPSLLIFRDDAFIKRYVGVNERVVLEILKHSLRISQ